jgi:SAM-dependent methyltransferase
MWDSTWESVFQQREWGKYPAESLIRFVARRFYARQPRDAVRILELGCGAGANLWYLAREGFAAYGVDGSPTAVSRAAERLRADRLPARAIVGDVEALPFPDGFFDAVIDVGCLCCNSRTDTMRILQEACRVLRSGGAFYSKTLADGMSVGAAPVMGGPLEYRAIHEGPLAGLGFVRLSNRESIGELYGSCLRVQSIDRVEFTDHNEQVSVMEWVVVGEKHGEKHGEEHGEQTS